MTSEEVVILIVLYVFALIIVILAARLWLAQRHIQDLKTKNPMSAVETKPIIPMILDHKKSVPKASDANVPKSTPTTIAAPILYKILVSTSRIIGRLKHYVNQ
jgi:Flp pilus assembly protein CpaB